MMISSTPQHIKSPLRRLNHQSPSINNTDVTPIIEDDEVQRRTRRSLASVQKRLQTSIQGSPNRSATINFDVEEVKDHFKLCFKLFNENKINCKNAWNLFIIDHLAILLTNDVMGKDTMLIAATTLEICSKVYACRVDDLHSEGLKLASTLARLESKPDDAQDKEVEGNEAPKKKKKQKRLLANKTRTVSNQSAICCEEIPKLASIFFTGHVNIDSSSTDNLFTNKISMDHSISKFMLMNKVSNGIPSYVDAYEGILKNDKFPFKALDVSNIKICPSFMGFQIDEWDPDQEEAIIENVEVNKPNSANEELVYDESGIPIAQLDGSIHDIFANDGVHSSDEEDVGVDALAGNRQVEMIHSFCPDMNKNTIRNSTIQDKQLDIWTKQIWMGPSHWKHKILQQSAIRFTGVIAPQLKPKTKKKKTVPVKISFDDPLPPIDFTKKYKPIKLKYSESRCTLPRHILTEEHKHILDYLITKPIVPQREYKGNMNDDYEHSPYNYDNPNDSQYCSENNLLENNDDPYDEEQTHQENAIECCERNAALQENIVDNVDNNKKDLDMRQNLIEAPETVIQSYIPYALQAKKINMKRLKTVMWNTLTKDNITITTPKQQTVEKTSFKKLYDSLPLLLPQVMQKDLSPHLAFVALLHLANENNLKLTGQEDLRDLKIESECTQK